MQFEPRAIATFAFQLLLCAGALVLVPGFPDPAQFKLPIMLVGCLGLLPLLAVRLRAGVHLLPGILFFCYLYARILPTPNQHAAALALLAGAVAFLFGSARVPLASARLLVPLVLLCVARSAMDLVTLGHLGGEPPAGHAVTSFFLDKHVTGGVLVLGALLHFHRMERDGIRKPVPALLYTSCFAVLLALVLCDSRVAQGAFLACFLPLLFLAIRLDGKEPGAERIAWVAGATLCLGLAWINLPEQQLQRTAESLAPALPGTERVAWSAALGAAGESPLAGKGVGTFRWASTAHLAGRTDPGLEFPVLRHAGSHFLEALAEGGAIGCALEIFLLGIALAGMAVVYFRDGSFQAKYGFIALAALSLIGLHTSALDTAPLNVAYWALIGYGWSYAAQAFPRWLMPYRLAGNAVRRDRIAGAVAASALACLVSWHLLQRAKEFQGQRLLVEAQALAGINPRASTDRLAESLAWDPRNEEANYSYARVLAFFQRREEAEKRVAYIQGMAPDWRRGAQVLGEVYQATGDPGRAADKAGRVLATYPHNLDALELLSEALLADRRCGSLDSFRLAAARLKAVYPLPPARDYTINGLDSLFQADRSINFLQRWFAGPAHRQRFVERRLLEYGRGFRTHNRAMSLQDARCPAPEETPPGEPGEHLPWEAPGGLSPEGDGEPMDWTRPRPKPPAPKRRKKFNHRNFAALPPGGKPPAGAAA